MNHKHAPETMTGILIEGDHLLSLTHVCQALNTNETFIIELISHEVILPQQRDEAWLFDSTSFRRAKLAVSFYHDLGINLEGIALALELIDRLENQTE